MTDTEREAERRERERRERQREEQAPCREPDVGLNPRSPGSHPGLKAALDRWAMGAAQHYILKHYPSLLLLCMLYQLSTHNIMPELVFTSLFHPFLLMPLKFQVQGSLTSISLSQCCTAETSVPFLLSVTYFYYLLEFIFPVRGIVPSIRYPCISKIFRVNFSEGHRWLYE